MDVKTATLLLLNLFLSACASPVGQRPALDIEVYYANSKSQALERKAWQEPYTVVKASSKHFDNFIGLKNSDFAKLIKTYVYGCKVWKKDPETDLTEEELEILKDIEREEF